MSKRNFILIIIILVLVLALIFGFFYLYQPKNQTGKTTTGTNFFASFLPFGKNKTTTSTDTTEPADVSGFIPSEETQDSNLRKISSFPIAGYGIFMKERLKDTTAPDLTVLPSNNEESTKPVLPTTEFALALRYVNRATGNIYQTFVDTLEEHKFSSKIIPKVYEAFFGNTGQSVVMRYLKENSKTIETFVGTLQKEYPGAETIGTNDVNGSFLPENISDISVSPDTSKIFYLFNIGDSAAGIVYSLLNNTKVQVLDSPFTEWLSFWPNNKMITVTTKPSANVPGYMYAINPDKKDFNKVLGGINGLTTLASPSGKLVLYADNNLSLNIFDMETMTSNSVGLKTLPEKCVWSSNSETVYCSVPKFVNQNQYPDSWYQGEISFSDEIWKIDILSGNTIMLIDPVSISGEEVDGIKLSVDDNQNFLFFVNKKDSYLWKLNLK